jgi:hypothetical protein
MSSSRFIGAVYPRLCLQHSVDEPYHIAHAAFDLGDIGPHGAVRLHMTAGFECVAIAWLTTGFSLRHYIFISRGR